MIRGILLTQQRELVQRLQKRYVERELDLKYPSHDLIRVVLGPRRAGKSFFAMRLVQNSGARTC